MSNLADDTTVGESQTGSSPNKTWAILIGIDFYLSGNNLHPTSETEDLIQNLSGCVADVLDFQNVILSHFQRQLVEGENLSDCCEIKTLTSTVQSPITPESKSHLLGPRET